MHMSAYCGQGCIFCAHFISLSLLGHCMPCYPWININYVTASLDLLMALEESCPSPVTTLNHRLFSMPPVDGVSKLLTPKRERKHSISAPYSHVSDPNNIYASNYPWIAWFPVLSNFYFTLVIIPRISICWRQIVWPSYAAFTRDDSL